MRSRLANSLQEVATRCYNAVREDLTEGLFVVTQAMSNHSSQCDNPPVEADLSLRLDTARLLETIQQFHQSDALATLRTRIAALQQHLRSNTHTLHAVDPGATIVTFHRDYLIGELEQIAAAQTLERARYYLDRLARSVAEERTSTINDINLNRWKEYEDIYTDSLWIEEHRDKTGVHRAGYWGNFIPQIPYQMMRRYTKTGDWVLDAFAGAGTTLIEAQRLGRNSLGVELQPAVADHARHLIAAEPNAHNVVSTVVTGDSTSSDYRQLLQRYGRESVQLVMLHPPYFNIIKFSDDARDLSNTTSVEAFLALIGQVIDRIAPVLDRGRYLTLVIGDKYAKGEWIPLGFRTMDVVLQHGFLLKSIIVKNFEETTGKRNQKELWKYRALVGGFYIFKHEYIFVFKKR